MPPPIEPTAAQRGQAALWLARRAGGSMTADDEKNFVDWFTRDPNHARAYRDAEDLWSRLDAPAHRLAAEIAADQARARRQSWSFLPVAVVLAMAVVVSFDLSWLVASNGDVVTAPGERKVLGLPDGSRVEMGPDSALDIERADRRIVALRRGEAYFEIRPGPARSFTVDLGDAKVEVIGTKFDIDRRNPRSIVTVLEGTVEVRDGHAQIVRLEPGQRAIVASGKICCVGQADLEAATAWRSRRLVFDNASLADVVAAFQRQTTARIFVMGSDSAVKVSGTFPADDVQNSLDTIASATGLEVLRITRWVTILY